MHLPFNDIAVISAVAQLTIELDCFFLCTNVSCVCGTRTTKLSKARFLGGPLIEFQIKFSPAPSRCHFSSVWIVCRLLKVDIPRIDDEDEPHVSSLKVSILDPSNFLRLHHDACVPSADVFFHNPQLSHAPSFQILLNGTLAFATYPITLRTLSISSITLFEHNT